MASHEATWYDDSYLLLLQHGVAHVAAISLTLCMMHQPHDGPQLLLDCLPAASSYLAMHAACCRIQVTGIRIQVQMAAPSRYFMHGQRLGLILSSQSECMC